MRALILLKKARKLLAKPESWCKGEFAKTRVKEACAPSDYRATSWCLSGAIFNAQKSLECFSTEAYDVCQQELSKPFRNVVTFNDHPTTTHRKILRFLDRVIKKLEKMKAKR
jgi:hypothetical protein